MSKFSKALNEHWTQKKGMMSAKMQFKTLDGTIQYMKEHNINSNIYHPYICRECGMWHIGHNKKLKRNRI